MITTQNYVELLIINDTHFSTGANAGNRIVKNTPNLVSQFVDIVNEKKPKATLILGDIVQSPSDWATFLNLWGRIDETIPKYTTIGNHDFDDTNINQLENYLGVANDTIVAGSRFNKTFSLNSNIRMILVDSTFDSNDVQGSHYNNIRIHTSSVNWLRDLLLNSPEKTFVIGTHCLPHLVGYFHDGQRVEIQNMINDVLTTRPDINISWIGGHQHELNVRIFENMGSKQKGYLLPAMVETPNGRYTLLRISDIGHVSADKVDIIFNG